jgi:hypothetical protein
LALLMLWGCSSGDAPKPPSASTTQALTPGLEPRADQGHLGPGSIRCSRCHDAADRNHPKWRETAMRLGHDVQSRIDEKTTCKCCHLGEVKGFGEPLDRVCAECHDTIRVTITGMGKAHCVSCHDPTASGGMAIRESAWECQKCHAKDQGDKPAIDVHAGEDCANCHRPHEEPWTLPRKCTECHVGHETFHGAAARPPDGGVPRAVAVHDAGTMSGEPMACATCHRPHEVGGAASGRCFECHAQRNPTTFTAATTFAGGHERCTTCHEPHGKAGPRSCRACHASVVTMAGRASEPHAKCVNCHKPHDVRGTAKEACVGCHLSVHPTHPDPKGLACIGCHEPHPGGHSRATPPNAAAETLAVTGFPQAASPVVCSHCHTKAKDDLGFHAGKMACKGCHAPHQFDKASAPACSTCHARQQAAATSAGGRGHSDCKTCHQAHDPKGARPECASCHAEEAKTAPAGHSVCLGCHEAHPTSRAPKVGCTNCHAAKKAGPHAPLACSSCHRPHGPDAPAGPTGPATKPDCTSCHDRAKLGGLHTLADHATCSGCHGAHRPPSGDRATCLACHADRKEHEPTAAKCNGCHGFLRSDKRR